MQRYLLPALFLVASAARAQTAPVITSADMPVIGDSLRLSQAAVVPPAGAPPLTRNGTNQTWDYSGLVATSQRLDRYNNVSTAVGAYLQFTFNNSFISPDTKANLVAPRSLPAAAGTALPVTDPLEFFNSSTADFRSVGFGGTYSGVGVPVTYATKAQQDVIYHLPLAFGNADDLSHSLLTTPALVASTGYFSQQRQRTNHPDAWGTLKTPFGMFQTVRVVTKLVDHDSIALGGTPGQGADLPVRREYKWLAKSIHVPVLTIVTNEIAGQEIISAIEYRDVYRRFIRLGTRDAATDAVLNAYPNPSAVGTALRLAVPAGSGPLTVSVADLLGRHLGSQYFSNSAGGVLTLDAALLGNYRGVLLLTVTTAQGTATRRVVRD